MATDKTTPNPQQMDRTFVGEELRTFRATTRQNLHTSTDSTIRTFKDEAGPNRSDKEGNTFTLKGMQYRNIRCLSDS